MSAILFVLIWAGLGAFTWATVLKIGAIRETVKRLRDDRDYWFLRATNAEAYIRNPHPLKHPVRCYDSVSDFLSSARPSPESE